MDGSSSSEAIVAASKEEFKTTAIDAHSGTMNVFSVTYENLKPGTLYQFKVGSGGDYSNPDNSGFFLYERKLNINLYLANSMITQDF